MHEPSIRSRTYSSKHGQLGFTLVELLFTVAVMAILGTLAAPAFQGLLARSEAATSNLDLVGSLRAARAQAAQLGVRTLICASSDGRRCSDSGHWEHGWLIATDRDHDSEPDGAPLFVGMVQPDGVVILGSRWRSRIRYHADGSAPGSNASLTICHRGEADSARQIIISNAGRVRQSEATAAEARACLESS